MTTAEVLRAARAVFMDNPGEGVFLNSSTGAVCMIGAVGTVRGCADRLDELSADEWPEVRALAQAINETGFGVAGGGPLQFTSAVVRTSDAWVREGRAQDLRPVWDRAIEIEEAATCAA